MRVVLILGMFGLCAGLIVLKLLAEDKGMDGMKTLVRKRFPRVVQIQPSKLASWLADSQKVSPLLLDVRTSQEYEMSHLLDARRIDPDASVAELIPTLPTNRSIVVYCSVGYRSSDLASRLQAQGFTNVQNLEGSIFQWVNEGYPVYRDEAVVTQVHPYNSTFGKLLRPEARAPIPSIP